MKEFLSKMKGGSQAPPIPGPGEITRALAGSCASLSLLSFLHSLLLDSAGLPLIMAPLGASAVLVFGAFRSPLAQPRNVIGGHVLSGFIGVTVHQLTGGHPALAVSLAVPLAIALMHRSGTLHPPGGATAFVAAAGGQAIEDLGYWYVLTPCALGSVIMVASALLINNLPREHRYPLFW